MKTPFQCFLLLIIALLLPGTANSKSIDSTGDQWVSFAAVVYTSSELLIGNRTLFDKAYLNKNAPVGVALHYRYQIGQEKSLGITIVAEQQHGDWYHMDYQTQRFGLAKTVRGLFNRQCFTVAGEFSHTIARKRHFELYLVMGAGATIYKENDVTNNEAFYISGFFNGVNRYGPRTKTVWRTYPNIQFSPLCLRTGRSMQVFIELGFGYKGLVNGGLSYKISSKKKT